MNHAQPDIPALARSAESLQQAGRIAEAAGVVDQLLALLPGHPALLFNAGTMALQLGRIEQACDYLRRSVAANPRDPNACINLAVALAELGRNGEAATVYRQALALDAANPMAYTNFGNVLAAVGQYDEALSAHDRALALRPDYAEAHVNRGNALLALRRHDEARTSYEAALSIQPLLVAAWTGAIEACRACGEPEQGAELAERALSRIPGDYDLLIAQGNVLVDLGREERAVGAYSAAVERNPSNPIGFLNRADALWRQGRAEDALADVDHVMRLDPQDARPLTKKGFLLRELGRFEEALACYREHLKRNPDDLESRSAVLFFNNYRESASAQDRLREAVDWGRIAQSRAQPYRNWKVSMPSSRLRVGLVSGDLRHHPVGFFLEGVLAHVDPARIEWIAFPTLPCTDDLAARLRTHFSEWRPLARLEARDAAALIRDAGMHVLIDLSGHTSHNRLEMFAWRPAPVQASWLGYFATTGLSAMDYFIADEIGVPAGQQCCFTEKLWYLPDTRLCFTEPQVEVAVSPLPARRNGHVTFGSFQNMDKINDRVLRTWAAVLKAVPDAQLRVQNRALSGDKGKTAFAARLRECGIEAQRVTLHGETGRQAYFAAHGEVDILLDTFPYPGGTTTCEALWMGVPTVSLAGESLIARQGASLLTAAGLADWVVEDVEAYVRLASDRARQLEPLAALRAGLREQVRRSPLFDSALFAERLTQALEGMWRECGVPRLS